MLQINADFLQLPGLLSSGLQLSGHAPARTRWSAAWPVPSQPCTRSRRVHRPWRATTSSQGENGGPQAGRGDEAEHRQRSVL